MYPITNAWRPGFRRTVMGQLMPAVSPIVAPEEAAPVTPPSAPDGIGLATVLGAAAVAALGLGVGVVSMLFHYGVAREAKTGLTKTTGYIMAGAGALSTLVTIGAVAVAALSGKKA